MISLTEFADNLPMEVKCYGSPAHSSSSMTLHAGKLSMRYEHGSLRHISIGNTEIIRMVYSSVRDKHWLTAAPQLFDEQLDIQPDSFKISYTCRYQLDDIDFWLIIQLKEEKIIKLPLK